jgi:DnaJ like chaperone protein
MPWQLITKELATAPPPPARSTLVDRLWRALGLSRSGTRHNTVAFTIALVSLSAKLAKADGVALPVESAAFERLHQITDTERANVRRIFDLAARDVAGFEDYADKVAVLLGQDTKLLRDVLEGLFHIAAADGILHPEEERYLQLAARRFGLAEGDFTRVRALFIHDPNDPYTVLALDPTADAATIKRRYRELVREHHPDQLIGRGVPAGYVRLATDRLAAITAAYERITRERRL